MKIEKALKSYRDLIKIRMVEESIAAEYSSQDMRCPVHLSIGQEAIAVGVAIDLRPDDVVFSTHRCHSHYLAKGGDLNKMIAELYGRNSGCAKGYGGSMHLVDESVGMMGSSAISGGSIPLSVGAAFSFKFSELTSIAVNFFGDGAAEEGVFYESLNFAALKNLPVIFVCENNWVATESDLDCRKPLDNIYKHGEIFGIPGIRVDGNKVEEVNSAAFKAVKRAREGLGPSLIECSSFRIMKHVGPQIDKTSGSRTPEQWEYWNKKCPIKYWEETLKRNGWLSSRECIEIRREIEMEIKAAFDFAKNSPLAEPIQLS